MKKNSLGVFAADEIPRIVSRQPVGLIANTDAHHLPGKHWVAIYVDSEAFGYFFDSLARSPGYYSKNFEHFFAMNCLHTNFNVQRLQSSLSTVCGHYACYFLSLRSRNMSLIDILVPFGDDYETNDHFVYDSVVNRYPHCFDFEIGQQRCISLNCN